MVWLPVDLASATLRSSMASPTNNPPAPTESDTGVTGHRPVTAPEPSEGMNYQRCVLVSKVHLTGHCLRPPGPTGNPHWQDLVATWSTRQEPVQTGSPQQPVEIGRDISQDEATPYLTGAMMHTNNHPEPSGVMDLGASQVHQQVTDSPIQDLVKGQANLRNAVNIQPPADRNLLSHHGLCHGHRLSA
jgi:hypothetical protein